MKAVELVLKLLPPVLADAAGIFGTKALASTFGLDHCWAVGN